jgi:anti-sigma factor RsiW
MSTRPEWNELSAFVDGELAPERAREIADRAPQDAVLQREIEQIEHLSACVKASGCYYRAPESLRLAVRLAGADRPRRPRPGLAVARQWFAWRPMASALALAGLFAFSISLTEQTVSPFDQLQEEIIASHLRATVSRRIVDVASSDRRTLVPFLSARLDFSPRVDDLDVAGSSLVGARVDYVDGRAVAALVYRVGDHLVDSFVWPTSKGDTGVIQTGKRGFQLARWSRDGMAHCVISDVSPEQFSAIVRQLESSVAVRPSS